MTHERKYAELQTYTSRLCTASKALIVLGVSIASDPLNSAWAVMKLIESLR